MVFSALEKRLNVAFKNKSLLLEALTHRSFINGTRHHPVPDNERLEFLGDAVLQLIITDYLYKNFPDKKEGELTNLRSLLVSNDTMARAGESIGLSEFVLVSKGQTFENPSNAKASKYILADAFEALIGAVYLDRGYETALRMVDRLILAQVKSHPEIFMQPTDPKALLQEKAQEKFRVTPCYKVIEEIGPNHDKHFVVGVYFSDDLKAKGEGRSKREAERMAAENALSSL